MASRHGIDTGNMTFRHIHFGIASDRQSSSVILKHYYGTNLSFFTPDKGLMIGKSCFGLGYIYIRILEKSCTKHRFKYLPG